jgi:hypothetical protein
MNSLYTVSVKEHNKIFTKAVLGRRVILPFSQGFLRGILDLNINSGMKKSSTNPTMSYSN